MSRGVRRPLRPLGDHPKGARPRTASGYYRGFECQIRKRLDYWAKLHRERGGERE
jgi:hypothetical protein